MEKNYSIYKVKKGKDTVIFDYDKVEGYQINPKVKKTNEIAVNKIVFVDPSFSEKIIRKKIDKKIAYLLERLRLIEEGNPDEGGIRQDLMEAEKLRLQIINNYVKYLGHTYEGLTLKKIQIIINQLRFKLYTIRDLERENEIEREGRRGR